jgi:hypothetical protein
VDCACRDQCSALAMTRLAGPRPAGSMGCLQVRPQVPKPAGASEPRARKGPAETAVSRDPSPWPADSSGCQHVRPPVPAGNVGSCLHVRQLGRDSPRIPKPIGASEPKASRGTRWKEPKSGGARSARPGHGRDGITADQIPGSSVADISHERAREQVGSHRETQKWHHPRGLPRKSVHSEHGLAPDDAT